MSTGRLTRAALVVNESAGRLLRAALSTPTQARGRLLRASLTAPLSTAVSAGPDLQKEGLDTVTISPTYVGATPVSWTWLQVSGPPVVLTRVGPSVEFQAPGLVDGAEIVLSVSATNAQTTSPVDFVTVRVYPHGYFELEQSLGWVPKKDFVTLT